MEAGHPILTLLATVPEAKASELARAAGVSQPTLSRLLRGLSGEVVKIGRGPATSYARRRRVRGIASQLPVYRVGEDGKPVEIAEMHLLWGGRQAIDWREGKWERFDGLPPFAVDMAPQGFLGRGFSDRWPDLDLPSRIQDWSDDHRLIALARRGEDTPGNLIVGEESLDRFLRSTPAVLDRGRYPEIARREALREAGSSAAGEWPKFAGLGRRGWVLVKLAPAGVEAVARRWRDLLVCEWLALALLREAGVPAAETETFEEGGMRFLESLRFDRVGSRGRRGTVTLFALDNEYVGFGHGWARTVEALRGSWSISGEDARRVRWLDTLGALIANTDRHLGNITFFASNARALHLAPAYDMLPMLWAPAGTELIDRPFTPTPPTAATLDVWADAAKWAIEYWRRVEACAEIAGELRRLAAAYGREVAALAARVPA
ncbi:MAG: type II toxin-antitoxin system HipA family toxin YjjJ [Myxococcales bacterium]|nr:type II toxin-antitoxin system HipA family toxin YjjJ [Myxococcales bacterium]